MTTFVLVHGAFCGGWIWQRVARLLRDGGHEVFAPTLTGLGERCHLLNPDVGIETHCRDIGNVITYEDLRDVVLVGHSYGGSVITGAAGLVRDRIGHLVYLDAAYPDRRPPVSERTQDSASQWDQARLLAHPPPAEPPPVWGVTEPADVKWMSSRLTPQPLRATVDPFEPDLKLTADIPRTCISCTVNQRAWMVETAARIRADRTWRYREMPTGHFPMVTMPKETAELLMEVAELASHDDRHGSRPH